VTDEHLIRELSANAEFIKSRGFSGTAVQIEELIRRFKQLKETHGLLAAREERLTQELVALRT
jgi:hypothetical protein